VRPVNLLPDARQDARARAVRKSQKTHVAAAVAVGSVLVVILVLGFELVGARNDISDKRTALAAAQQELAAAQAAAAMPSAAEADLQARLTAFTSAASTRVQWDQLLADLAAVMPKGAWLTSLKGESPSVTAASGTATETAPGAAPSAFVIGGFARTQATVAQALDRLALIPTLTNVSLQQSQRSEVVDQDAVQFSISASVRGGTR
jgi:Tfp pilus assembly protein PilN